MKIDRLLGITIYLLNHKKTSATSLAERFEVSVRTIQRDIESICLAGIPVVSTFGVNGGYEIMDTFKIQNHPADENDYLHIITALEGYVSAYEDNAAHEILEKMQSRLPNSNSSVKLDFSVAKEQYSTCETLSFIQTAIADQKTVSFDYTNAENITKRHEIEPVYVIYKWYAWYLIAYRQDKDDYIMYKLIRMEHLIVTANAFSRAHDADSVYNYMEHKLDNRENLKIRFICKKHVKTKCIEYLKANVEQELEDGSFIMTAYVLESEHFWYGTLLSLEDYIKILEPQKLIDKLCKSAKNILVLYEQL